MKRAILIILTVILSVFMTGCSQKPEVDATTEKALIKETVNNNIGWALTKDTDLLYRINANDENFFIFNPDSNETVGFKAFKEHAENVWLNDAFKATHFKVKKLRINLSASGDVAWYSCYLDDFYEWNGTPGAWENVRWSGVVEKRNGIWVHVQMHFSFPR